MSDGTQSPIAVPPVVALAGWVLPGAGYLILGQRARALTVGITILILFIGGLFIGGMRVVDAPASLLGDPMAAVLQKPWYVAQILAGPIAPICASIGRGPQFVSSHARVNEIGTLYTAVAGMLNLLVIVDSTYRAAQREQVMSLMGLLLAAAEKYSYSPFVKPAPLWNAWYLLALPLCLGIAIVYKSVRCETMRRVPRQAAILFGFIIAVMIAAAGVLAALVTALES